MTVEEYLKIVNNIPEDQELSTGKIKMSGFIILIVYPENFSAIDNPQCIVTSNGYLLTKCRGKNRETREDEDLLYVVPLQDDISLHGVKEYKTAEEILAASLEGFKDLENNMKEIEEITGKHYVSYAPRIERLEKALMKIKGAEVPNSGSMKM